MKKFILILLTLILTLNVGCSSSKEEKISLYQRGLDLINEIDYIAENKEIVELIYTDEESLNLCQKIGSYDYGDPKAVYEIKNILDSTYNFLENKSNVNLPQESKDIIKERLIGSFSSIINAQAGTKSLTVASILSKGNAFKNNMTENTKTYLYTFEKSEYKFVVTFFNHQNGVVSAGANILINDEFNKLNKSEDFENYLNKASFNDINLVEVSE